MRSYRIRIRSFENQSTSNSFFQIVRCGIRTTYITEDNTRVVRRCLKLAQLRAVVVEGAGGEEVKHGPKSAHGLWDCLETNLSEYAPIDIFGMLVPDGASVFGASQAEQDGLNIIQAGSNVAHLWNEQRLSRGLTPLQTMHCTSHRGALADKDTREEFMNTWAGILSRSWHHWQESGDGAEEYFSIQRESGFSPLTQPRGSEAKWCGFAEAMAHDAERWSCKHKYWRGRVRALASSDSGWVLANDAFNFYDSVENHFVGCGCHPLFFLAGTTLPQPGPIPASSPPHRPPH